MKAKIKHFSREEGQFILDNAGKLSRDTMSKILKRKPQAISRWANKHGIRLRVTKSK